MAYYLILIYFFFHKNKSFLSSNIKPVLLPMSSLKIHGDVSKIIPVKTGIIVEEFPVFNIDRNNFVINCMVWFKFNRCLIDLESIGAFSFLNTSTVYKKELVKILAMGDDFFVQYKVLFGYSINVDQKFFPINDHSLYLVMINESFSAEEIVFDVNSSAINFVKDLNIEDWNLIGSNAEAGYGLLTIPGVSTVPITHPEVLYTMNVKKAGLRKAALIIIPILLILFIATSTVLMPPSSAISIVIGSLTGILTYRFVINTMSPNVGYFTLADHIYNFCLLLIFITFLLVLIGVIHDTGYNRLIGEIWIFGTRISVIVLIFYLLFFWQKTNLKKADKTKMKFNAVIASINEKKLSSWTINRLKSNVLSWYKGNVWRRIFLKSKSPTVSWNALLNMMLDYQNEILTNDKNLSIILPVNVPSKCVVLANNKSQDIIRHLEKLNACGIIDNELKMVSPHDYIIFHQNTLENLDELVITFSIQLILMKKNPKQVFLLQDKTEIHKIWQKNIDVFIRNNLYKKYPTEFKSFVENFFELLPKSIYLENRSSPDVWGIKIVSETQENVLNKEDSLPLKAKIYNTNMTKYFSSKAIFYSIPNEGVTIWNVNSNQSDEVSMAVIEFKSCDNYGLLHWYKSDSKQLKVTTYSLAYCYKITQSCHSNHLTKELIFGASMDLVKTMSNRSIKNIQGITMRLIEQNSIGGIQDQALRMLLLNDNYTPLITKKNIEYLIANKLKQPIIFSTLGTPTTECLAPLVKDKKILLLFPCTGSNLLRAPEYENLIFFRASYAIEGLELIKHVVEIKGCKRIAIYYQNDALGLSLLSIAKEKLNNSNINWVAIPYQRNSLRNEQAVAEIKKFNPDGLVFYATTAASIAMVHQLGVENIAEMQLFASSAGTNSFVEFLSAIGISLTYSQVVPRLDSNLQIVKEYHQSIKNGLLRGGSSAESLEGYINASLVCEILSSIEIPITVDSILEKITTLQHVDFKGLTLNYNPEKRELFDQIWIESN